MDIVKEQNIVKLIDLYINLLTPRQQEILKMHYHFDISISEIAENFKITRQSVKDCIDKCKSQLTDFEEKLKFLEKEKILNSEIENILNLDNINTIKKKLKEHFDL
ncbi:MAG: hypothetical protein FWG51_04505 [Firmicutes bacterium]|nr:hypothetical protein [Bacillota bacterium]